MNFKKLAIFFASIIVISIIAFALFGIKQDVKASESKDNAMGISLVSYIEDERLNGAMPMHCYEGSYYSGISRICFVGLAEGNGVTAIDASDVNNPKIISSINDLPYTKTTDTFCIQDDIAFTTSASPSADQWINAINISDKSSPVRMSSIRMGNFPLTPNCLSKDYVPLQTTVSSIGILNVSNASELRMIVNYTNPVFKDSLYYLDVIEPFMFTVTRTSPGRFIILRIEKP